jgi:crotonobetainyl-CoA:carnitine CoA-transferase CaiB-like acyl-CoA transferase
VKILGNPVKMSGFTEETFTAAPTLGEHNQEILSGLLGYSQEKIDKLKKDKII